MVEKISDKTLYHVTAEKPYKQLLRLGQKLNVGEQVNPFFGFYEGARQYAVTQADGSVLNIKAGAFLRQVMEGKIQIDNLAGVAFEVATHFCMLVRELVMEDVRREVRPDAPSRQRCMYLCDTLVEAQYWNRRIGDNGKVCSLRCTGVTHRGDASLLLGDSEPLSVMRDRAQRYWRGEAGDRLEWEMLFSGAAVVLEVGL